MFLHSLSSCLPLVSQMSPPTCLEGVVSQMFSPSPLVVLLSSSSLPAVVSRLSSGCLPGVVSHPFCCLVVFHLSHRCGLKIVLQWSLRPCTISICFSELVDPKMLCSFYNAASLEAILRQLGIQRPSLSPDSLTSKPVLSNAFLIYRKILCPLYQITSTCCNPGAQICLNLQLKQEQQKPGFRSSSRDWLAFPSYQALEPSLRASHETPHSCFKSQDICIKATS